ncbi:hypothetical protein [Niabella hibiscisoli]|uniref:hypothetical protein n=1 Tax=Niabella hibiscisoli TaxID=1825928 RepID=UPI001F0D2DF1|nr:hypothetical protein [Niabella hibiscisoli]MCH5720349.1 hypothetical protein [Niabella hibiscisoli]
MNSFINTLSDTVLSKPFESCNLEELQALSQKHPYSSAIQLLYAQKLQKSGSEGYQEQLQKTLLYYSNPLFIKHLIETEEQLSTVPVATIEVTPTDTLAVAKEPATVVDIIEAEATITQQPEQSAATTPEQFVPEIPEVLATPEITAEELPLPEESGTADDDEDLEAEDEATLPLAPI